MDFFQALDRRAVRSLLPLVLAAWAGGAAARTAAAAELPRVLIVATGGTIAGAGYAGQKELKAADLLTAVPELAQIARLTTADPFTTGSSQITPEMLLDLVRRVRRALAADPGLAGVVVTQGTDALEETAFFCDLLLADDRPVVFTAAMRPPTDPGPDGPRNLAAAVRAAASPALRGFGVLVVLNDEIHAAREVRKTDSYALDAFASPGAGPIGFVDEGRVYLRARPLRRLALEVDAVEPRVELVTATVGGGASQVQAAVAAGAKGIVIELFGRGNPPGPMVPEILAARQAGIVVVFTTRTGGGRVVVGPNFRKAGVVSAEDLDGLKARMLLIAALPHTQDPAVLQGYFEKLAGKV
jgi:L-asparaginase